jgi:RES domain-containing protein
VVEFPGRNAFWTFAKEIAEHRRYVRSPEAQDFLKKVGQTCHSRTRRIEAGTILWRAQVGHDWIVHPERGRKVKAPHPESRMKPLDDRAYEGRVNPKGIPCLYFATSPDVAMSEVRPWIGSTITVSRFRIGRDLNLVDCSQNGEEAAAELGSETDRLVWASIDDAFSQPVTESDNTADYAATQALAEVFGEEGLDGVIYRTAFSAKGKNVAVFDLDAAELVDSSLYEVNGARFEFEKAEEEEGKDQLPKDGRQAGGTTGPAGPADQAASQQDERARPPISSPEG